MYTFVKADEPYCSIGNASNKNFIDLLKSVWDELHDKPDVFRYKINNLQERMVDNKYLLQLNPNRGTKRRTPEAIFNVCQPFDENKFNFTKVSSDEIVFNLIKEGNESDIHSLIVNVSPISRYHTLLCPSLYKCHPQVITEESLVVALDVMCFAQNRNIRIGFNSLCGFASLNHLHYHLFLEPHTLPVEIAKCKQIKGPLFCLQDYVVPAFCFQIQSEKFIKDTASEVYKLLSCFLKHSIAHNLFITRGDALIQEDGSKEVIRIIIWPRKSSSGVKQLAAFNVAVCELSGWFPIFDKNEYEKLKKENLENELKKWKIDDFDILCKEITSLF